MYNLCICAKKSHTPPPPPPVLHKLAFYKLPFQLLFSFIACSAMASGCPLDHLFNRNHEYMLKYKCLQCGDRHGAKKEARKHAVTHDQSLQTLLDQWLKNRGRCHVCNRCGREFKSEQIWTNHQKYCGGVLHPGVGITTIKNRLKTSI